MFRKRKTSLPDEAEQSTVAESNPKLSKKIKFNLSDNVSSSARQHIEQNLSDIDVTDREQIRVRFRDEWKDLEPYTSEVSIVFHDLTFAGSWHSVYSSERWGERILGRAMIVPKYDIPLLQIIDWDDSSYKPAGGERFSVSEAAFNETEIQINQNYAKQLQFYESVQDRDIENWYIGSPSRCFRSSDEAEQFIRQEIMPFDDRMKVFLKKDEIPEGKVRRFHWPEIVFSPKAYREYDTDDSKGFFDKQILLPDFVYSGIRSSLADFRDGIRIIITAEMELLGIDITKISHPTESTSAALSLVPDDCQLTGKIVKVAVDWDSDSRPFSNPSAWWDRQDY